jgi:hypothetical protein
MGSTPDADFSRLAQYGAVGVIAAGLLALVVMVFKQLITHALDQNKKLSEQQHTMQEKTLEALHAIGQGLRDVQNELRSFKIEVSRDVADMVRDEGTAVGRVRHPTKPPR